MTNSTIKKTSPVIAVDGTAASGKGTLARRLAKQLGFTYLDTGKLYRYVGYSVIKAGGDPADEQAAVSMAQKLQNTLKPEDLDNPDLKSDIAGLAASKVGVFAGVRKALVDFQIAFAYNPPEGFKGAILDGRDIGTVICPDADLKLYIDAKTEIRAERRHKELQSVDLSANYDAVLADMRERDYRDSGREAAPMIPADDAVILDTTEMSIEEVLKLAVRHVKNKLRL